jgi:hypothetical protein
VKAVVPSALATAPESLNNSDNTEAWARICAHHCLL